MNRNCAFFQLYQEAKLKAAVPRGDHKPSFQGQIVRISAALAYTMTPMIDPNYLEAHEATQMDLDHPNCLNHNLPHNLQNHNA